MSWQKEYQAKLMTEDEACKLIKSGTALTLNAGNAIPAKFAEGLGRRAAAGDLKDMIIIQGFALGYHDYLKPEYKDVFHNESIFIGPVERYVQQQFGTVDYAPNHLVNMYGWPRAKGSKVLATTMTPPDENGYMNRSNFGCITPKALFEEADIIIAEVNENLPWCNSDDLQIHVSECAAIIENHAPIFEMPEIPITEVEKQIAGYIVDMIPNGVTIQLGMGGLANCVGHFLKDKKDLGVHSEIVSNSIMELIKCGTVNNSKKSFLPGITAYAFSVGTQEVYDFINKNKDLKAFDVSYINDPNVIARNDNLYSINNALMLDLVGQVASETIGTNQYSATGGQFNFVQGSQWSKGGRSIIALPSTYKDKDGNLGSRILSTLPLGTIVTTSRNDVQWVVTEYGARNLRNEPISKRVKNLIEIAHPDFRDELTFEAKKYGWTR